MKNYKFRSPTKIVARLTIQHVCKGDVLHFIVQCVQSWCMKKVKTIGIEKKSEKRHDIWHFASISIDVADKAKERKSSSLRARNTMMDNSIEIRSCHQPLKSANHVVLTFEWVPIVESCMQKRKRKPWSDDHVTEEPTHWITFDNLTLNETESDSREKIKQS